MTLKVEVISKEILKPSTPTPIHLQKLKLSVLDQCMPAVHVPVILFYSKNNADLPHLKKSLSVVITDFYPLAGRVSGNQFIDCNDEGVNFVETQVDGPICDVVSNPEVDQLSQLFPGDNREALLSIQANKFGCGGLAISVSISHKVGDASSLSFFVNHWAAVTRGDIRVLCLDFNTASLFPPHDDLPSGSPPVGLPIQKLVSKRYVFDAQNIAALKAKISDNPGTAVPTRVETVGAFIWRCAMNAVRMRVAGAETSQSVMGVALNFRGRMVPPASKFMFGNIAVSTQATSNIEDEIKLSSLVVQLQEAKRRVDGNYTTQLQTEQGFLAYYHLLGDVFLQYIRGELEFYILTSWCRFPFYEVDFGWGEPSWVTYANFSNKNVIALMDTKCGHGIEAWVTLDEEDMTKFQCEPDLTAFFPHGSTFYPTLGPGCEEP